MSQIQPIVFPLDKGTATNLAIETTPYLLGVAEKASFKWILQDVDGGKTLDHGIYTMTDEEFAGWGTDDNYVIQIVANSLLGVVLV